MILKIQNFCELDKKIPIIILILIIIIPIINIIILSFQIYQLIIYISNYKMKDLVNFQYKIGANILELMRNDEVIIEQINGQRILNGPPPGWVGPPPGSGTEIFVGKLPREIYEDTIYPFFAAIGQVYELRLMLDFSGNNRGYCFVKYTTPQEAKNAIKTLNDKEILPGRRIGVVMSVNNCKLWIGKLPKEIKSSEVILVRCIFFINALCLLINLLKQYISIVIIDCLIYQIYFNF